MKNRSSLARSLEPFLSPSALRVETSGAGDEVRPRFGQSTRDRRVALIRRALVVADVVGLTVAALLGAVVAHDGSLDVSYGELFAYFAILGTWLPVAKLHGLYGKDVRQLDHSTFDDLGSIFHAVTSTSWFGVLVVGVLRPHHWNLTSGFTIWLSALVMLPVTRVVARAVVRRSTNFIQNAVIVGAGDVGQLVGRKLSQHPEFGINLVGFVDSEPKELRPDLDGTPLLGGIDEIVDVVREHHVQRVVVAFSNDRHDTLLDLVHSLRGLDVEIDVVPRLFEAVGPAVGIHTVEGLALVGLPSMRPSRTAKALKRALDVATASLALLVTGPLFLWIAFRIRRDSPGPVFFRQVRLGEHMRPFTVIKFRTMRCDTDDQPHREYIADIMAMTATPTASKLFKLDRPDAVTKFGAWLRRTSLDELPQLINVLRGDMSLVGPRPCMAYETEHFEQHHFDRFLVPAGMTGLWQVEARARSTFKEALDLDAAYARNWSLLLDLWLLARTPTMLFRSGGATR
jgi:exopolysaccharide biosynthesis polyprenyl glycosylphosphotransferase